MSTLPPLPKIDGNVDLMLDVYTHSSLHPTDVTVGMNDSYGDTVTQRLEELGTKILDLAVTIHFYNERPSLNTAEDIRASRALNLLDYDVVNTGVDRPRPLNSPRLR